MIKHISFDHLGGWYHFRLHEAKLDNLAKNIPQLKDYLKNITKLCPNDYFNHGPRSSSLAFNLNLKLHQVTGHEISDLTRQSLQINNDRFVTDHSKVQVFMLENDDKTIAVEVPVWIENHELNDFKRLFKSNEPLTGHIDLLRIDDNKIWVWDYKPGAYNERFAATQVYFYALMLSKRTNIPLEYFRCGYFDSFYSYIFKPEFTDLKSFI